jgi:hypothetical protein
LTADHDSHPAFSEHFITMSNAPVSSQSSSTLASKYPNRSLFAHFDFQRPPTLPSSSKSGIRRWTGKWHTSPQDYYYLYDDDTCPLNPTLKKRKPHVKSVFPEYELDELQYTSSTTTAILGVDGDESGNEDVWSTIAIASIESPESNEEKESEREEAEVVSNTAGNRTRLTIEKIGKHGSIAKKQKDRKQVSAFPAKANQFFALIKNVFRSKSAKPSRVSMIEIAPQNKKSIATENEEIHGIFANMESSVLETSAEESTLQQVINDTSTMEEDKNVSFDATTCNINQSRSDSWQDDDIIVKRKNWGNISLETAMEKDMATEAEGKSGSMTILNATISFQEHGGIANCEVDTM